MLNSDLHHTIGVFFSYDEPYFSFRLIGVDDCVFRLSAR